MKPLVSVLIVTYQSRATIDGCLDSVQSALAGIPHEVIIVDNASSDGTVEYLTSAPGNRRRFRLLRSSQNLGFAAGNNLAFRHARGRFVMLLNPDARIVGGKLVRALEELEQHRDIALIGGRVQLESSEKGESAHPFPGFVRQWLVRSGWLHRLRRSPLRHGIDPMWAAPEQDRDVDWIPGAFALMRRATIRQVGGFDERFFLYWEEVDLCRRLRSDGKRIRYRSDILIAHEGGESAKQLGAEHLSEHGNQLTGWQWRSAWLYYRKHNGAAYARTMYVLECTWQRLRLLRAALTGRDNPGAERLLRHLRQSWWDTQGGAVSPPAPWRLTTGGKADAHCVSRWTRSLRNGVSAETSS